MTTKHKKVAILGASSNPDRYSYRAFKLLREHGHTPLPVHPSLDKVEDTPVYHRLSEIPKGTIDTLTLYVNPTTLETYVDQIIDLKPNRVIFNPGTESSEIKEKFEDAGIETVEGCTLIMLRNNQF